MRSLTIIVAALALAACEPQAADKTEAAPPPIAETSAAPTPIKVSNVKCDEDWNTPTGATKEFPSQAQSESGAAVFGSPDAVTCDAPADGKTVCQANGPTRMVFAVQDYWYVNVPAAKSATVTVTEDGSPTCFLNE